MSTPNITFDDLIDRLDKVKRIGHGQAVARCPSHADKSPSLTIKEGHTCILLHCFAGCSFEDVVSALGLEPEQLLYERTGIGTMWRKPAWARDADALRQMTMKGEETNG